MSVRFARGVVVAVPIVVCILVADQMSCGDQASTPSSSYAGLSRDEDSRIAPAPPGKVRVEEGADGLKLAWQGTGVDILVEYRVYVRCGRTQWKIAGTVAIAGDNRGIYRYPVKRAQRACGFAISAVDQYGGEGPRSDEARLAAVKTME